MDSLLPFLQGTCTPYNMPVYPGALRLAGEPLLIHCTTTASRRLSVSGRPRSLRYVGTEKSDYGQRFVRRLAYPIFCTREIVSVARQVL
jgi:hypothetical protein